MASGVDPRRYIENDASIAIIDITHDRRPRRYHRLLVLMEEAVERGWAAFSQAEAARRGVEWLDLVPLAGHDQTAGGARGAVRARRIVARRLVKAPTRLGFPCAGDSVGGNVLAALA